MISNSGPYPAGNQPFLVTLPKRELLMPTIPKLAFQPSEMRSNEVLEKGKVIAQLNHQKIRNRVMPVAVDFDQLIGEPRRVPGIGWAVPCDVVGLDSKKAKSVKVRFHPSLAELSRVDRSIANAALRDALKYLDALLENGEWTRHNVKAVDSRIGHLDRIAHFLTLRHPTLVITRRSLDLMWPLHTQFSQTGSTSKLEKAVTEARCSLHNHSVATGVVAKVEQTAGEDGQDVVVLFEKPGLVRPILRLSLQKDPSYLQTGVIRHCWKLTNNDNSLCVTLPRAAQQAESIPLVVPQSVNLVVMEHQKEVPIMMEECQLRVDDLRRRLDESLTAFQRSSTRRDAKPRALHIVRQNNMETLIEISNPGERARFDRLMASSPLNVICCNGAAPAVATSPADSTDSGVAVSPLSSPVSGTKHSPFYQYSEQSRIGMRQRSASECVDWDGVVLKSILKKPQRTDRMSRSISESHHFTSDSMHLSLLMESTTEVDESDAHTDHESHMVVERKKRVSFSEKVQERRFRVGQCILTAAKKNERKRAYKKRKEERQRSLSEDEQNCETKENSTSSVDVDAEEKPGIRSERQDSGFVDGDENDYEDEEKEKISANEALINPEERWKNIVRQQREVSTH
ncbi:hypothetical protein V3C99_016641 [Haemonchus contortus]